tara:strand:+ start:836 stop:1366 length:531 start_codon:yes stop_codon:yes gene_type:complete
MFKEANKIIASIILAVIIIFFINRSADYIYQVKAPKINTYKVEVKNSEQNENLKSTSSDTNINDLLAMGDIEHGKKIFGSCKGCHSIKKGGGNKIGPALWAVLGRPMGAVTDYKYSKALSSFGKTWDFETMNLFLIKPKAYIKGTKMSYAGLKKEKDRASVILYLNAQSDSPITTP